MYRAPMFFVHINNAYGVLGGNSMSIKKFDLFGNVIRKKNSQKKVCYIKCGCRHLAIRQKGNKELFRCSMCRNKYVRDDFGCYVKKLRNNYFFIFIT